MYMYVPVSSIFNHARSNQWSEFPASPILHTKDKSSPLPLIQLQNKQPHPHVAPRKSFTNSYVKNDVAILGATLTEIQKTFVSLTEHRKAKKKERKEE